MRKRYIATALIITALWLSALPAWSSGLRPIHTHKLKVEVEDPKIPNSVCVIGAKLEINLKASGPLDVEVVDECTGTAVYPDKKIVDATCAPVRHWNSQLPHKLYYRIQYRKLNDDKTRVYWYYPDGSQWQYWTGAKVDGDIKRIAIDSNCNLVVNK